MPTESLKLVSKPTRFAVSTGPGLWLTFDLGSNRIFPSVSAMAYTFDTREGAEAFRARYGAGEVAVLS